MDNAMEFFRDLFSGPVIAAGAGAALALLVWPSLGQRVTGMVAGLGVPDGIAAPLVGLTGAGAAIWLGRKGPSWAAAGGETFAGVALYGAAVDAGAPLPDLSPALPAVAGGGGGGTFMPVLA